MLNRRRIVAVFALAGAALLAFGVSRYRAVPLPAELAQKLGEEEEEQKEEEEREGDQRGLERFTEAAEAQNFFALKRAPAGETAVPTERYLTALAAMAQMPQFSSATGSDLPSRAAMGGVLPAAGFANPWTALGPGNIGGRSRTLVIDPTAPATMYIGGVAGGVWKTTTGGAMWTPLTDLLPNLAISAMAMDPANPAVIYAGTGEGVFNGDAVRGAGIFKTTDGGATWSLLAATGTSDFYYVNDVVVSNGNPLHVFAATRTGVWRSLDGGTTWGKVLDGTAVNGCLDLAARTDAVNDYLFAACGTFATATVYRNVDAGGAGTWTAVLSEAGMGRTSLSIAPSNQNIVYAMASSIAAGTYNNGLHAVFRSTSSGDAGTWTARVRNTSPTKLNTVLLSNPVYAFLNTCFPGNSDQFYNQGWYDNVIAVDPVDPDRVWTGGVDLFRSTDGGQNWAPASRWWGGSTSFNHADQHGIVFHPGYNGSTNQTVFTTNDGGLYRSDNAATGTTSPSTAPTSFLCGGAPPAGAVTWSELNNNYAVTQLYHGLPYPGGATYFGGTQDNGTVRGTDAGGTDGWSMIMGGDGGYVAVDPTNTNTLYAEFTGISIQKSTNGGASWVQSTSGISDTGLFITPFAMDPTNPNRLWVGGALPWRTANAAASWTQAGVSFGTRVSAIAVAPTNPDRVAMGTQAGTIRITTTATTANSGTTWAAVTPRSGYASWVAFDPVNELVMYATYSTFGGGAHVWRSANGGASWTGIDGSGATGIPDIPVHSLVVDPANTSRLYIGTDLGVFVSRDGGGTWAVENSGFANVITEALAVGDVGGVPNIFAFTHGRGVYRVAPVDGGGAPTVTIVATDASATEAGQTTGTFTVTRTGSTASPLTVSYSVAGSATSGADYTALPLSVTIPSLAASATIVVSPVNDADVESDETVIVTLTAGAGYVVGAPGSDTVTIVSDDVAAQPDLTISSLGAPSTAGALLPITIKDKTTNVGMGTAPSTTTAFYLSTDNTFDGADVPLGSRTVPSLAPGATSSASTTVTIPAATIGKRYIIARADSGGGAAEANEANNTRAKAVWVGPDLIIKTLTGPATATRGSVVTLNFETRNNGGAPAGASTTRVYLSTNKSFDATDTLLTTRSVPALAPKVGDSVSGVAVTIPAGTATGARYFLAIADDTAAVAEAKETNNKKTLAVTIAP